MPIPASSVYRDVQFQIHGEENGELQYDDFNRVSKMAETMLLSWGTGNIAQLPGMPEPYTTQKAKDFIAFLITKTDPTSLDVLGQITRPSNYYAYENMYALSLVADGSNTSCDEDEKECGDDSEVTSTVSSVPVELLDGQEFYYRSRSYIRGLRPSERKPIAKQVGKRFEFLPKELPAVVLEYVRYPVYAEIKTSLDTQRNDLIINEATTVNYEWDESAREMLVYFIVDLFSNHTREGAMKGANALTHKNPNV